MTYADFIEMCARDGLEPFAVYARYPRAAAERVFVKVEETTATLLGASLSFMGRWPVHISTSSYVESLHAGNLLQAVWRKRKRALDRHLFKLCAGQLRRPRWQPTYPEFLGESWHGTALRRAWALSTKDMPA